MVSPSTNADIASTAPTTDNTKAYSAAEAPRQSLRKFLASANTLTINLFFSMPYNSTCWGDIHQAQTIGGKEKPRRSGASIELQFLYSGE